jgi:predicted nucleic acid-binding protein
VNYLIDTNVISEAAKPQPNRQVLAFLHETDEDRLFISVITLAELRRGIALKADGKAKSALETWLSVGFLHRFSGRILDVTPPVADAWGRLMADAKQRGVALHVMDGFLAATAQTHGQTLVTRNVKDFAPFGLALLNPWDDS